MRIVGIIQARMGSTRLPGKVLLDLAGEPMLARVVSRTKRASMLHEVVVATTTNPADERIVDLCTVNDWSCFCGSEDDVLDRYYQGAVRYQADVVVRITSDCPLIEPQLIDQIVQEFLDHSSVDYASNTLPPRTFPRGLDVEVITFEALKHAWSEDDNPVWREHVTPYIYRHPEKFRLHAVRNDINYSHMRWTVDTPQDLTLIRRIYEYFGNDSFSWCEVLALLEHHPEWLELNKGTVQKEVP